MTARERKTINALADYLIRKGERWTYRGLLAQLRKGAK